MERELSARSLLDEIFTLQTMPSPIDGQDYADKQVLKFVLVHSPALTGTVSRILAPQPVDTANSNINPFSVMHIRAVEWFGFNGNRWRLEPDEQRVGVSGEQQR